MIAKNSERKSQANNSSNATVRPKSKEKVGSIAEEPDEAKVSCAVRSGGKGGNNIKALPITIFQKNRRGGNQANREKGKLLTPACYNVILILDKYKYLSDWKIRKEWGCRKMSAELTAGRKRYTYEDYYRLPEGSPYQLIGGELVMTPSPTPYHQMVSMKLELKMAGFVLEKGLGIVLDAPIDVYLEETETYQPDIIFISNERLFIIEEKRIKGAPDLVVEILSPNTGYYDLRSKYKVYEKSGVREYWLVDPQSKSVQVFCLREGKFTLAQEVEQHGTVQSRVIPGFAIQVESIF